MQRDKKSIITVPSALKKALAAEPKATDIFDRLPPSHRKEYALWIADAKKPATVQRRLEKMIPLLLTRDRAKN